MFVVCRAREIRARNNRRIGLWERGLYTGLVGDLGAEGAAREGRATSEGMEEDKAWLKASTVHYVRKYLSDHPSGNQQGWGRVSFYG